jgi:lysophospholipase L1-like esterase
MDVVLEEKITPKHEYQWQLFAGLLRLIKEECDRQNARLIVVGIPYLPQVYDDVWNSTFAGNQAYSRTAAIDRVRTECRRNDIAYVDALEPMQQQSRKSGRWLHYRKDAHPTAEGQDVIAEAIFRSEVIQPGSGLALIPK